MLIFISILLGFVLLFFFALQCPIDILVNTRSGIYELRYAWIIGVRYVLGDDPKALKQTFFIGPLKHTSKDEPGKRMRTLTQKRSGAAGLRQWRVRPNLLELLKQFKIRRFDVELDNSLPWLSVWVAFLDTHLFRFLQLKVSLNQEGDNTLHFEGRILPAKIIRVLLHSRLVRY